jgi:aryl-alcohol dehydrogenase-like predicted oxidoreductase
VIRGHATREATESYLQDHQPLAYSRLGAKDLSASQAGFGCYRVSAGVAHHANALRKSLFEGINLIDTSTNYADGGSEALVGQVLEDLVGTGNLSREAMVVVSKVGYLQGRNYTLSRERRQQGNPFPELVEYGEGLEHCIHPEFLRDQLNRSLERLNLETLDFFLLHSTTPSTISNGPTRQGNPWNRPGPNTTGA